MSTGQVRRILPGEEAALDGFLAQAPERTMFLRSNLARHGLDGADLPDPHPHATVYFGHFRGPDLTGVLARTVGGMLLVHAPEGVAALIPCLTGTAVIGMTGDAAQVAATLSALGLDTAEYAFLQDEPLCTRALPSPPESSLCLRMPTSDDLPRLAHWFAGYIADTGLETRADEAQRAGEARAALALTRPDLRLLERDGALIGMTDFNARAGDTVQIGGVYVVPEARGQGWAGHMIEAHLAEAWHTGTRNAVLFANNDAAFRAYARIGFERVGTYRVALLAQPFEGAL